jgi:hypothetical protein
MMFDEEDDDIDRIRDAYMKLPIYKKGMEISDMVDKIAELIPEDNENLQEIKGFMLVDSAKLFIKVAGAESGELYDMKMEAASIIRKSAKDLMLHYHSLKMLGFKEYEYYMIVRNMIEEYRLLFIDWVAGFDKTNYCIDRWGLFNPPGVGPFDKTPDDDIPFDPDEFFPDDED